MKKIWITGAEGHIGTALIDLLEGVEYQLLPTDINEVDITKIDEVTQFVHVNRPDVVINCAGLTDVQECENNVDEAYRVNAIGVRNVALAANEVNAKVIQISTDDVFDKESRVPYNEFDNVHPRTIYGKSKEAGEKILTQLHQFYNSFSDLSSRHFFIMDPHRLPDLFSDCDRRIQRCHRILKNHREQFSPQPRHIFFRIICNIHSVHQYFPGLDFCRLRE